SLSKICRGSTPGWELSKSDTSKPETFRTRISYLFAYRPSTMRLRYGEERRFSSVNRPQKHDTHIRGCFQSTMAHFPRQLSSCLSTSTTPLRYGEERRFSPVHRPQ